MCNSTQKSTVTQIGFIEPLKTTQISSKFLFPVFTSNNTARITQYICSKYRKLALVMTQVVPFTLHLITQGLFCCSNLWKN